MIKIAVRGARSWGTTFAKGLARLSQTAQGLGSVSTALELARVKGISMPIVEQVQLVRESK